MPAQRILIIKHGALGDVVLAMGTMKRLRELHPEAHITLMTMGMFVPMAEQLGVFDDFIVDNRLPYWKLGATWRAVRSIVKGNFDVVYDLQESSRTRKRYYPAVRFLLNHDMDWVACNSGERRKLLKKKSFRWGKVVREPFRLERVLTDLSFMHGEGLHFDELPERYVMMIPGCSPNHPWKISVPWRNAWRRGACPPLSSAPGRRLWKWRPLPPALPWLSVFWASLP